MEINIPYEGDGEIGEAGQDGCQIDYRNFMQKSINILFLSIKLFLFGILGFWYFIFEFGILNFFLVF